MNLNKENTFTPEWHKKFPNVSKHFCKWIDQYKKENNWNDIFQTVMWSEIHNRPTTKDDYDTHQRGEIGPHRLKFHDIPIELQYGVICKWLNSFKWSHMLNCPVEFSAVHNSFIWWCQHIEATTFGKTEK